MAAGTAGAEAGYELLGGQSPGRGGPAGLRRLLSRWVPITVWLPAYQWRETGPRDLAGALTLGFILVAQSLAHADLCHVSVINGPYSCILPPIIYAFFGTCIHASVGTGGLVALLTGVQLQRFPDLEQRTHAAGIFTLEVGIVLTIMGFLQLAFLVRFLSRPALSGFITASALLIMESQVVSVLGLPSALKGKGLLAQLLSWRLINPGTAGVSAVAVLLLTCSKGITKLHPILKPVLDFKELFALLLGAVFCRFQAERLRIEVIGNVPSGLPGLAWPLATPEDVALAREMLPGACLVALVTFLSSFAGAKKFAMVDGYAVDATSELLSLGLSNLGGAFCNAVPVQIGLSRLGISRAAGVQTQLGANVFVAAIVAVTVKLCSTDLFFVPRCVLGSIILVGASHLTEFKEAQVLYRMHDEWSDRKDLVVWVVAFGSTLFIGAFEGIIVAVVVSLVLVLYQVAQPPVRVLGYLPEKDQWLAPDQDAGVKQRSGVLVFRVEGPIFYANAEHIQDRVEALELDATAKGNPLHCIVLSANAVTFVDSTGMQVLVSMMKAHRDRGITFLIANVFGQSKGLFERSFRPLGLLKQDSLEATVQDCLGRYDSTMRARAAQAAAGNPMRRMRSMVKSSQWQSSPSMYFQADIRKAAESVRHFCDVYEPEEDEPLPLDTCGRRPTPVMQI